MDSVRTSFVKELHKWMHNLKFMCVLTGDLGYGVLDDLRLDFPDRVWNMGASEQLMITAAVGLVGEGKLPICYSISPFSVLRPFEAIRNYLSYEGTPVKIVGIGTGDDYASLGYSHSDDKVIDSLEALGGIKIFTPQDADDVKDQMAAFLDPHCPSYMNLKK